ncbi:MAG: hypothetical protein QOH27_4667 [Mycobacterium sp.]|nr:hypothetical protein [Mycobacterium sp.]
MSLLTDRRTYAALAVLQAGDAVACGLQIPPIKKVLDDVGLAEHLRPVLPVVKAASALGLLSVSVLGSWPRRRSPRCTGS